MIMAEDWIFQPLTKRSGRMRDYMSRPRWGRWATAGRMIDPARWASLRPIVGGDLTPVPNVWLGVSVEDQQRANERIADLLATPAAIRWISAEPLLGPLNLNHVKLVDYETEGGCSVQGWESALNGKRFDEWSDGDSEGWPKLDWVVSGGESGPRHRDNGFEDNARSLRNQCAAAGVPFFGKQNVGKRPLPDDLMVREFPA